MNDQKDATSDAREDLLELWLRMLHTATLAQEEANLDLWIDARRDSVSEFAVFFTDKKTCSFKADKHTFMATQHDLYDTTYTVPWTQICEIRVTIGQCVHIDVSLKK